MSAIQKGKGGNIETKRNPFRTGPKLVTSRPAFADHSRTGLVIDCIINAGCACIVGATRDGGAVVLTLLDGEDRHRTYCSNQEELDDALTALEAMFYNP